MPLANSKDVEVRRGVAFALNNISTSPSNHRLCERIGVLRPLVHFFKDEDTDILLQSLVATRQLCSSRKCSFQFVDELQGLKPLLSLAQSSNLEVETQCKILLIFSAMITLFTNTGVIIYFLGATRSSSNVA
jgi:hypothetical protein